MVGDTVDYYELLEVPQDASTKQIKAAYYAMAKECHPDFTGDEGHDMCVLLNAAYDVLRDADERLAYDQALYKARLDSEDGFTGKAVSKWMGSPEETRGVFVDECSCIGCKNCVFEAPATFRIEPEHGRSRVFAQWLDSEDDMQTAIDSCPVDCIHWVDKEQLPVLEHVMTTLDRVSVGTMGASQGSVADVFDTAVKFMKRRNEKAKENAEASRHSAAQQEARRRAAEEIARRTSGWGRFWTSAGNSAGFGNRRSGREATMPLDRSIVPAAINGRKEYRAK